MCGIGGEAAARPGGEVDAGLVREMCRAMAHRGPDDEGLYEGRGVTLGQRRLSIIDLETGHQPLANEDETVWAVCNGEIYNYRSLRKELAGRGHRFRSRSDCEVLLHLYEEDGPEMVSRLRGMFAFAVWDSRRERLLLARDRLGQKPLFYARPGGSLTFASEIKALLQDSRLPRKLNRLALHDYLSFKFIPREETLFEGIFKLPPATWMIFEKGEVTTKRYWDLTYRPDPGMTEGEAVERTGELLSESVRMRLMSDVPLGAFLSSGLDSGLVVSMMSRASSEPVNTFTIGDNVQGFNEIPHARLVARKYGTNHREFLVEPDAVKILPDLVWTFDGPYADIPSIPLYYVSKLAREHVTVVLTGDAGDESFAGYDRYVANALLHRYRMMPRPVRRHLVPMFLNLFRESTARKSWRQSLRWLNTVSLAPERESYARGISFFSFENREKEMLYGPEMIRSVEGVNSMEGLLSRYWSDHASEPLDRMTYTDLMVRIPEYSNIKVDRVTMMHGLEARSPFMDHRLVEFAATIPSRLKAPGRKRKHLLRQLAASHLPAEILNLTKKGFGLPINRWLRGELKGLSRMLLQNSELVRDGLFAQPFIDGLLDEHESRRVNNGYKIWSLVNLETWYRTYLGGSDLETSRQNVKGLFHSWSGG
jgi:asparagine synthase (glutamine-hydrolysing)